MRLAAGIFINSQSNIIGTPKVSVISTNVRSGTFGDAVYKTAYEGERDGAPGEGQVFYFFDVTSMHTAPVLDEHSALLLPCSPPAIEAKKKTC